MVAPHRGWDGGTGVVAIAVRHSPTHGVADGGNALHCRLLTLRLCMAGGGWRTHVALCQYPGWAVLRRDVAHGLCGFCHGDDLWSCPDYSSCPAGPDHVAVSAGPSTCRCYYSMPPCCCACLGICWAGGRAVSGVDLLQCRGDTPLRAHPGMGVIAWEDSSRCRGTCCKKPAAARRQSLYRRQSCLTCVHSAFPCAKLAQQLAVRSTGAQH